MIFQDRRIFKRDVPGSIAVLNELFQNIFVGELIAPSKKPIWIVSPWITNIDIIDNSGGNFDVINPDWRGRKVKLQDIILHICSLRTQVNLITNSEKHNNTFISSLKMRAQEQKVLNNLKILKLPVHLKTGMLNDYGLFEGSMNTTFTGTKGNTIEQMTYSVNPKTMQDARNNYNEYLSELENEQP